jgi:hypothetical protein
MKKKRRLNEKMDQEGENKKEVKKT